MGQPSGGYGGYGQQGYGAQTNSMQPQGYTNNYNPQPMQGAPYSPGPPGWDMRLGSGGVPYMQAGASRLWGQANSPDWLKLQLGQYEDQPWATNPNQYGRWNWGTNMQGQGIPSPFGQYAQQFAQYPQLQFPPMPPGPGQPPPGGPGQPPPPPSPPQQWSPGNWIQPSGSATELAQLGPGLAAKQNGATPPPGYQPAFMDAKWQAASAADPMLNKVATATAFGYNSPVYQQLLSQVGGQNQLNQLINKYKAGGGVGYIPSTPADFGWKWNGSGWAPPAGDTTGMIWNPATQQFASK